MLHAGENIVNGLTVDVERKSIRRINLRIGSDARVKLSIPIRWATLHEAEMFLLSKWDWVVATRTKILSTPKPEQRPITPEEQSQLIALLAELTTKWAVQLRESGIKWKVRNLKSLWGSCHIPKRIITCILKLAHATPAQVEYVVVHEITHLQVANHGPKFRWLMDQRLPGWKLLRKQLNHR